MNHPSGLSHVDAAGHVSMVDVSAKPAVAREAVAAGEIRMTPDTLDRIESDRIAKGSVFAAARLAGIQAAKRTAELIPLCHPLSLSHCEVRLAVGPERDRVLIEATARITAGTGVEMEALTAVTVAALTLYDMCKAVDPAMRIEGVRLVHKKKLEPVP